MKNYKYSKIQKPLPQNNNPNFFVEAFKKRLGRTPTEYINEKIKTGSQIDAVKYLFNIIAAEISNQNDCKFFDFDHFYNNNVPYTASKRVRKRPENAGKAWSAEEEQLLIKMYNNNSTKKEMCDTFKRTENGLAARLVHLGIIKDRDEFRGRK